MYPQGELGRVEAKKAALRASIAEQRLLCVAAAWHIARPLGWLDECRVLWRRASPFVGLARLFFRFTHR